MRKRITAVLPLSQSFRSSLLSAFVALLILASTGIAYAQPAPIRKADEFYNAGGYYEAIALYKDNLVLLPKDELPAYLFRVAECYRKTGRPRQAELWYQKAILRECSEPKAYLYYANSLLSSENYDQAKENYEAYLKLQPNDKRAKMGLESCELAKKWKASPSGYIVRLMSVFDSKYNDFSPAYASPDYRTVVLTSSRDVALGRNKHAATGEKFTDLFIATSNSEGRWSKPKALEGNINTSEEEGTPNFTQDFTKMYYTRCVAGKKGKLGCQIYEASMSGEGWDNPVLLNIAADSIVVAHPAIAPDGLTLYFASDLPGGFGGMDLWKVTRTSTGDSWGEPINLGGTYNTEGDEMFPYVHSDGTLYFSSNGWPGMGGLDIFRVAKNEKGEPQVENMRYPINSSDDDFGITIQKEREEGFFTSRRAGGRGGDDIYWFYLPPLEFNLLGLVKDEKDNMPLRKAKVRLVGSDGSIQNSETNEEGRFKFILKPNTDYVAITSDKGYLNGKLKTSTKGRSMSEDLSVELSMNSVAKPIVLPNIFYDFNNWELRPESMNSLNNMIEILNDNPTIIVEMGAHTDARGSKEYNLELSQKRAQAVVNYLIEHGIPAARLRAKGYAQSEPFVVTPSLHEQYDFLPLGQLLDEAFISTLADDEQKEAAWQANRRTQFRVISNDYMGK
ncbi:MAG: OmpA family protein [Bacteroides sp.]